MPLGVTLIATAAAKYYCSVGIWPCIDWSITITIILVHASPLVSPAKSLEAKKNVWLCSSHRRLTDDEVLKIIPRGRYSRHFAPFFFPPFRTSRQFLSSSSFFLTLDLDLDHIIMTMKVGTANATVVVG